MQLNSSSTQKQATEAADAVDLAAEELKLLDLQRAEIGERLKSIKRGLDDLLREGEALRREQIRLRLVEGQQDRKRAFVAWSKRYQRDMKRCTEIVVHLSKDLGIDVHTSLEKPVLAHTTQA